MAALEERYDDAMFDFSTGDYAGAVEKLKAILAEEPSYFDARLSLGMAYCRLGDVAAAIAEGHRAEEMRPNDPLVHTNLSLYYVRAGDKGRAEHHGLQARIASWKGNLAPPPPKGAAEAELEVAKPALPTVKIGGPPSSAGGAGAPPSAR